MRPSRRTAPGNSSFEQILALRSAAGPRGSIRVPISRLGTLLRQNIELLLRAIVLAGERRAVQTEMSGAWLSAGLSRNSAPSACTASFRRPARYSSFAVHEMRPSKSDIAGAPSATFTGYVDHCRLAAFHLLQVVTGLDRAAQLPSGFCSLYSISIFAKFREI